MEDSFPGDTLCGGVLHAVCLLVSALRVSTCGVKWKKAGLGRKRNPAGMQAQWKPCLTSVGSWSFQVVLNCDDVVRPLYSYIHPSLEGE